MIEFIFGIIFGIFILLPLLIIGLLVKFPFQIQHGLKKSNKSAVTPPPSHISPYLYRLFTNPTTATTSTLPQQQQQSLLDSARNDILTKLEKTAQGSQGGAGGCSGESLNWLNLFLITVFSVGKQILEKTDQQVVKTCIDQELPLTGTIDTEHIPSNFNGDIGLEQRPPETSRDIVHDNPGDFDAIVNTDITTSTTSTATTITTIPKTTTHVQQLSPIPSTDLIISSFAAGSKTILPILNRILTKELESIPFLGPTRITHLDIQSILPQINHIKIVTLDIPTNTIVFDLGVSFTTDSTAEVDLSAELQYENLLIASLPAQVAIANIHTTLDIRIAIDPGDIVISDQKGDDADDDEDTTPPSVSISLVEPPVLRFDLATSFGYSYWLTNLTLLHAMIHKAAMVGTSALVAPNFQTIELPKGIYTEIVKTLVDMATK